MIPNLLHNLDRKKIILLGFLFAFVTIAVLLLTAKLFLLTFLSHPSVLLKLMISRIIFWLWLAAIYWYVVNREMQPLLLWAEQGYSFKFYIVSVFSILIVLTLITLIITLLLIKLHIFEGNRRDLTSLFKLSWVPKLLTVTTAAVVEELIFRGYLIPRLQLFFKNIHWPIIISSVIFGLGHISYGTISQVLIPAATGLIFGYHYYKYRNISVLMICHFLIDSKLFYLH